MYSSRGEHANMPTFYAHLKVHKNLDNPQGRPIVSGVNSSTSNMSIIVDDYLKPLVSELPSFLKDTTLSTKHKHPQHHSCINRCGESPPYSKSNTSLFVLTRWNTAMSAGTSVLIMDNQPASTIETLRTLSSFSG